MLGNHQYAGLHLGDARLRQQSVVVTPSALTVNISPQNPDVAIDAVVAPRALSVAATPPAPLVAIDIVVLARSVSISATAPGPMVFAPLAISRLRERVRCEPVMLVEVAPKNGGPTLCFADRNVSVLGQRYEDYIDGIDGLASVRFKNDSFLSHARLIEMGEEHPFEGAEVTVRECLLDDDGTPSEAVMVTKGVLDAPRQAGPLGFTCAILPMESSRDRQWKQDVIETGSWPGAHEDLGEVEPLIYGANLRAPALRVDWGASSTLKAKISATATSLELSDASRFPQADFHIWLDDEKAHVSSRSGNVLSGLTRGAEGTTATAHRKGSDASEARAQYDSLLASHELHSVGDVYAEINDRLVRVTSGVSAVYENGKHLLRATERIGVRAVEDDTGISDGIAVGDDIGVTVGGANKSTYPTGSSQFPPGNVDNPGGAYDGNEGTFATINKDGDPTSRNLTVQFSATDYGPINTQWVHARLLGDISVGGGWTPSQVSAPTAGWFRFQKSGGGWADAITFANTDPGEKPKVCEVYKEADYSASAAKSGSAFRAGSVVKTGGVVATHNVERFHAVVSGFKDTDGNYGGMGTLIERPDRVIQHFIVERMGFSQADIDAASFDEAGSQFAVSGYSFAFRVDDKITPSEFLKRMARECRSSLRVVRGKWKLQYIADSAPAAMKKIPAGELAGEFAKFRFSRTPVAQLANDITARFRRNYSRLGKDSAWDATASVSDAASSAKYGAYIKEEDFTLIRDGSMAAHVLNHMLLRGKEPRLTVEFPVFWEHFDLEPGDTVEIDNPLFGGRDFLIQDIRRTDKFRAELSATEWW